MDKSAESAGTLELYCRTLATELLGLEHIAEVAETQGYNKVPPRLIETVNAMTNRPRSRRSPHWIDWPKPAQALSANAKSNWPSSTAHQA